MPRWQGAVTVGSRSGGAHAHPKPVWHRDRVARPPLARLTPASEWICIKKNALLKDLQHSRLWQARLEACQNALVKLPSCSAGGSQPIKHILRHVGYAAHRFESVSGPRRLYVCLMLAIAMVLADIAGDTRRKPAERARAEKSLTAMTPQHIMEAGAQRRFRRSGHQTFAHLRCPSCSAGPCYKRRTSSIVLRSVGKAISMVVKPSRSAGRPLAAAQGCCRPLASSP